MENRWNNWQNLYTRPTSFGNETGKLPINEFSPNKNILEKIQKDVKVLVVGAGGLGCEILKVSFES